MGMEDEEFFDLSLVDAKLLELPEHIRQDVPKAPIYDHGLIAAIQQIDPRFLAAQIPQLINDFSGLANSHERFSFACFVLVSVFRVRYSLFVI
jgi:hypothetical protein